MPPDDLTAIDLDKEDYRALVHIQALYGLNSLSDAMRLALSFARAQFPRPPHAAPCLDDLASVLCGHGPRRPL